MTVIRFLGDVHGKYSQYENFMKKSKNSIQVGDMGVGFHKFSGSDIVPCANPPHNKMVKGNHRFIRGNHDNLSVCLRHSQWISDGHTENNMMFVGGALSIDRAYRTAGLSWWPDEELSYAAFNDILGKYIDFKPEIMVTHDCPECVTPFLLNEYKKNDPSITRQAFEGMFTTEHKPKLWIFGHWHVPLDLEIYGCRFICLQELGWKDVNIETCEVL